VTQGNQSIYLSALMDIAGKEKEKKEKLSSKLVDLVDIEKDDKYIDLNVMFVQTEGSDLLKGVPPVRVYLE